jgi:hypothetical protein
MTERRIWKINYPCGCQFNGEDFTEPPEYCPTHGKPMLICGFPAVEFPGCISCNKKDQMIKDLRAELKKCKKLARAARKRPIK